MQMPRFFCPSPLTPHSTVTLPAEVIHHMCVLRLKAGDTLVLFDGQGHEFLTTLTADPKPSSAGPPLAVSIGSATPVNRELPCKIFLIQGLCASDKMDWIVEKAVELGVAGFMPVAAKRSVLKLDDNRADKKHTHWQKIIQSASQQCGRNVLMALEKTCHFGQITQRLSADLTHHNARFWIAHPSDAAKKITELLNQSPQSLAPLYLAIGPEGGWSPEEVQPLMRIPQAQMVSLGARVFRTETAALAAVAMIVGHQDW